MITPDDLDKAQLGTLKALQAIFNTVPAHKITETFCREIERARLIFPHWSDL